jgi:hypothetical protein
MNHLAIYALYPNVKTIDDTDGARDAQGNQVEIDMNAVNAWENPNAYKSLRADAYPSIADQLDLLYHGGMDAWKAAITAVKEEFPK